MKDIYSNITDRIVASLEKGVQPWFKPWTSKEVDLGSLIRPLRFNGKPYNGINVLILWIAADEHGFRSQYWMTYKQAQALGGQVRKGERSTMVVYASRFTKVDTETQEEKSIPFLRSYNVFNCDQIDGLPEQYYPAKVAAKPVKKTRKAKGRIEAVDAFFDNLNMTVVHGGSRAFYSPSSDSVHLPRFEDFKTPADYYLTKGHEAVHWTKEKSRCDRDLGRQRWGDEGYAMEELVAELGAAYLAADLGISAHPREDHASYIQSWLKVLKNDKRAIFSMARHAESAVAYLHKLQPGAVVEEEDEMAEAA